MGPTVTFKTTFSRFFPPLTVIVVVVASILIVVDGGVAELSKSVPFLGAGALTVWALFWVPQVEVSDGGIRMVNVIHIVHIPWPCFTSADPRWTLKVETTEGAFTSWALPAGSGTARRFSRPRRGDTEGSTPRADRQLNTGTAESAALVIAERLEALTNAGFLDRDTVQSPHVEKTPNRASLWNLITMVVLVTIGVLA